MTRTELGRRIATVRHAKGLSQEELGARARIGTPHVSEIERGRTNPSLDVLMRLAVALDLTLAKLFVLPDAEADELLVLFAQATRTERRRVLAVVRADLAQYD